MMRVVDHELSTQLNTFQALVSALHERQTGGASAAASTARKLASQTGADVPGQAGVAVAPGPESVASGLSGMGGMPAPGALGYGEDSEEVAATLRLLLVHADVSAGLNRLEADIRCGPGVNKCVDGVWTLVWCEAGVCGAWFAVAWLPLAGKVCCKWLARKQVTLAEVT